MNRRTRLVLFVTFLSNIATLGEATVLLRTGNYSYQAIQDIPAQFGPRIPQQGLSGIVKVVKPLDACSPLSSPKGQVSLGAGDHGPIRVKNGKKKNMGSSHEYIESDLPWIALISRSRHDKKSSRCTFDIKVRNAEEAGAVAALVYDDLYEGLIIMSKSAENEEPRIPSVFVSKESGQLLKTLAQSGQRQVQVILTPLSDVVWISMFMSVMAGIFALSIVMSALCLVRQNTDTYQWGVGGGVERESDQMPSHSRPLTKRQLNRLKTLIFGIENTDSSNRPNILTGESNDCVEVAQSDGGAHQNGDSSSMCAICLDQYCSGDKLRELPCSHRFHRNCIDEWLLSQTAFCPLCKASAHSGEDETTVARAIRQRITAAADVAHARVSDLYVRLGRVARLWPSARQAEDIQASAEMGRLIPVNSQSVPSTNGGTRPESH
jgi:E3 ubiquitin-protein ligase RNF13